MIRFLSLHWIGWDLWPMTIALIGLTAAPPPLPAESGQSDVGEVSGYGGVAFANIGAHPTVGAGMGLTFSRYCIALIDTSYIPLGSHTLRYYPGQVQVNSSRLYDFNFTIHVRVPLRERWEPYGIAGAAFLFSTYRIASISGAGILGAYADRTDANFGFETGGGLRYYVARNWGMRTEVRLTASTRNFGRFLAGMFYQFEGDWPFRLRHSARMRASTGH